MQTSTISFVRLSVLKMLRLSHRCLKLLRPEKSTLAVGIFIFARRSLCAVARKLVSPKRKANDVGQGRLLRSRLKAVMSLPQAAQQRAIQAVGYTSTLADQLSPIRRLSRKNRFPCYSVQRSVSIVILLTTRTNANYQSQRRSHRGPYTIDLATYSISKHRGLKYLNRMDGRNATAKTMKNIGDGLTNNLESVHLPATAIPNSQAVYSMYSLPMRNHSTRAGHTLNSRHTQS